MSSLIENSPVAHQYKSMIESFYPYKSFNQAQEQLHDLVPIDYFLAKELTITLFIFIGSPNSVFTDAEVSSEVPTNKEDVSLLFHLIIAISKAIRAGNSCLPLSNIAGSRFCFYASDNGIVSHNGYEFPLIVPLKNFLSSLALTPDKNKAIVVTEQALYLRRYYNFEQELNDFIADNQTNTRLASRFASAAIVQCLNDLFKIEGTNNCVDEIDWQKVAVANALNKRLSIIAGGPGTGKTYTVTKLLAAIVSLNSPEALKIALVAPTGKAAQRLTESLLNAISGFKGEIASEILDKIPYQAQTLHRLLGVIPNKVNFRHHQDNKLTLDVLVVDEVSMVDLPMMVRLIRALPEHCQLVLLGDADQLPSVAVGNVLADLAPRPHKGYSKANKSYLTEVTRFKGFKPFKNNAYDHITFLTKSRRFDSKGLVGRIAELVITGDATKSWNLLAEQEIPALLSLNINQWLPQLVKQYYLPLAKCEELSKAFSLFGQFRILCATRVGLEGVENINQQVEQILYNSGNTQANNQFYHGKPIMITQNDYGLGLFNGDIGLVWTNEKGMLIAYFEQPNGEYLTVLPSRLPSFESVYAMTIHKTQGSEFQHLVMVLPQNKDSKILSRELLYTGITRAKKGLQIASAQSTWFQSVDTQIKRYSGIQTDTNEH
ncbi:exodeoxyribonuclease V subunit alpha [Thalassotalea piscium]|uniref:RecBCD enzyme subunit RecD n=1 Tax=Thalassotalea piscium TaxID=1230533 RepID=A0A7X0NH07_9GAMM|nr:exodeoxyribonuclease V subunit alpha [Thalassotalea piscium]MBB6543203.1 exodeoxyribonuclease V alpha subunit [Thalassotalea piscium]